MFISVSIQEKDLRDKNHINVFESPTWKTESWRDWDVKIMQTENDESVESFCLQESLWRWSYTQSVCSSCTSRRAPLMPESFHSSLHMWRALVFNTINHRGGLGSWEGGLYSLDWTFDSAFWLVLRLVTMYLDDWIQKRCCCEVGAWLRMWFTPQTKFFSPLPYQVVTTICGLLCNTFHSITPAKQACLQQLQKEPNVTREQVASSYRWAWNTMRRMTGSNRAGRKQATDAFTTSRKAFWRYRNVTASLRSVSGNRHSVLTAMEARSQ